MELIQTPNIKYSEFVTASALMEQREITFKLKQLRNKFYNYVLAIGNEIVYIGYSANIYSRLYDHKQFKKFDKVILIEFNCEKIARLSEKNLIKFYKPKYNVQFLR